MDQELTGTSKEPTRALHFTGCHNWIHLTLGSHPALSYPVSIFFPISSQTYIPNEFPPKFASIHGVL